VLSNGRNGIAQVHAREKPNTLVGVVRAGAVLQQSLELKPEVFICFGRPDFDDNAINAAESHGNNNRNYKIIPIPVLVEMYVRFCESKLAADRISEILEGETGYITIQRL
jgi:hypothetical protein